MASSNGKFDAPPYRVSRKYLFFSNLFGLHLNVAVKYCAKKNINCTIKPQTIKSFNKTFLLSIKRIKIAQTEVTTLFFFLLFWSSFEFGCEKIATLDNYFCFSSDFGAKFTPSCYGIANASNHAA